MDEGPTHIGPYRVLSLLGEGGMGAVYAAEQRQPIDRRVAVKVVKVGMDTKEVLARFDVERKALALLDHPNIARILDAGSTPEGRPYFAMELVRGQPITRYCDANRMSLEQRVRLLRQACNAIQHAHDRGILHRDIKPSNLLVAEVDGEPYVKVIDFGLAKAVNQRLTERTLFTEEGRILGTIEYMSPEQADLTNQDIDHRADVYSLGAVLYELVAGVLPFDSARLRSRGLVEMQRAICEVDPPTPSKRLTELRDSVAAIAGLRQCALRDLRGALRRGLDAVVMKAMAKRRSERYASCRELAADLERFLAGGSVQLGFGWRSRQLGRRALRAVTSRAGVALVSMLVMAGVSAWAWSWFDSSDRYQDMIRERDERLSRLSTENARLEKELLDEKASWDQKAKGRDGAEDSTANQFSNVYVTRAAWGASDADDAKMRLREWTQGELIIQHAESATGLSGPPLMQYLQRRAVESGEGDVPFHFFVDGSGLALEGRDPKWIAGASGGGSPGDALVIWVAPGVKSVPGAVESVVARIAPIIEEVAARGLVASERARWLGFDGVLGDEDRELASSQLRLRLARLDVYRQSSIAFLELRSRGVEWIARWQWTSQSAAVAKMDPMMRCSRVTLHHSATLLRDDRFAASVNQMRGVQRTHMLQSGYGDIGYHFVIDRAGRVFEGRALRFMGAHASGDANKGNIGICLLGNFTKTKAPNESGQAPTGEQLRALTVLIEALRARHGISRDQVLGHNELKDTECPGTYLIEWLKEYRSSAAPAEAQGGK